MDSVTPAAPGTDWSGEEAPAASSSLRLADIPLREAVELVAFDLRVEQMQPLLERGVLPGCRLRPLHRSPFGDPIVEVEGTVLALRREMAACLCVRRFAERGSAAP